MFYHVCLRNSDCLVLRGRRLKVASKKIRDLDEQFLGDFSRSYAKRYEQWKRQDLILIAVETMPKQVDAKKLTDNLDKLKSEFSVRFNFER